MQVKTTTTEPKGFKPVTLEITFETQEELDRWSSLLNVSVVAFDFKIDPKLKILEALQTQGGKCMTYHAEFCRRIKPNLLG